MNQIKAKIDGSPVAVLSRFTAFGSRHVAQGTTLNLQKDGADYIAPGRSEWGWTVDQQGARVSDKASNFRLSPPQLLGADVALFAPCDPQRGFPDEAIEKVKSVKVGDRVVIQSRVSGTNVTATVKSIDEQSFLISTDYVAKGGDSGSLVTTESDEFVGFVSTVDGISVPAAVPGTGVPLPPPTPAPPLPPAPPVQPPTGGLSEDYNKGYLAGRTHAIAQIKSILTSLG